MQITTLSAQACSEKPVQAQLGAVLLHGQSLLGYVPWELCRGLPGKGHLREKLVAPALLQLVWYGSPWLAATTSLLRFWEVARSQNADPGWPEAALCRHLGHRPWGAAVGGGRKSPPFPRSCLGQAPEPKWLEERQRPCWSI